MTSPLTVVSVDAGALAHPHRTLDSYRCGRRSRGLSFARRVDVPFELGVARLQAWWGAASQGGPVEIGQSRLISVLPGSDDYHHRIEVNLGRGPTGRAVPMELELVRWSDALGTALELQPLRDVRPSARYFNAGHALLDAVAAIIDGRISTTRW